MKSPPWHMKPGMMRWKALSLKLNGTPALSVPCRPRAADSLSPPLSRTAAGPLFTSSAHLLASAERTEVLARDRILVGEELHFDPPLLLLPFPSPPSFRTQPRRDSSVPQQQRHAGALSWRSLGFYALDWLQV